jgi:hypothetical protein
MAADMTNTLSAWNRNDQKAGGPGLNRTGHIGTRSGTHTLAAIGFASMHTY